ncbi:MAG: Spy/CpxP family protein refolding chaperone [Pirellulaceae bacterium]|jgi:Spy/CpxP family protein refolding chaperone|nr:Spy/CpxP family protein refolding chaperone [Pirellulaceae bacterium]
MMTRARGLIVLAIALVLGAAFISATQAQERERSGRRFGRGSSRSSLLGLLGLEQVQKEMKLSEEQTTKVQEIVKKLRAEMQEQYTALREIEDRDQQRAKITELRDQSDQKVREQLGDVVEREQVMRLYQIRTQVRAVVDSLANSYISRRLKLTDDQKNKLDEINKGLGTKQSEVYATMRDANDEQRSEAFQKLRKIRSDADAEALALLTAEQKAAFEEMKGEKIELQSRRRRQ